MSSTTSFLSFCSCYYVVCLFIFKLPQLKQVENKKAGDQVCSFRVSIKEIGQLYVPLPYSDHMNIYNETQDGG
jgi:hypothetical protein